MATYGGVGTQRADSFPPMPLALRWSQVSAMDAAVKSERGWSFDACLLPR
jgi:hypothetical protein